MVSKANNALREFQIFESFFRSRELKSRLEQSRVRLYRLAYSWCHDPGLADDLVQETLLKALNNHHQIRDRDRMESWLFSILTNCWRDYFRRQRPMDDIDEMEDAYPSQGSSPEDLHLQGEIVSQVRHAISKLPMGQRQVLTLVDLEEFSYGEAAEILAIPVGTVMSRLCRARQALKECLETPSNVEPLLNLKVRRVE